MMSILSLSFLPADTATVVRRYLLIFASVFLGGLATGLTNVVSVPTLKALVVSAAAAGLGAVAHAVTQGYSAAAKRVGLSASFEAKSLLDQLAVTAVETFLSIFGAALVAGAAHLTSLPSVADVVLAAISAGVAGVVQAVSSLVPTPTPTPATIAQHPSAKSAKK